MTRVNRVVGLVQFVSQVAFRKFLGEVARLGKVHTRELWAGVGVQVKVLVDGLGDCMSFSD